MARDPQQTTKSLRKRIERLKGQLDAERDARNEHIIKVRNTFDELGATLKSEREAFIALQEKYDDLLMRYEEVRGDSGGQAVQEQEAIPDHEGGPFQPTESVEEG